MAGRQYVSGPNSRFFSVEDDDVDDETFLRHSKSGSSGYMLPNHLYQEKGALEDSRLQLAERKKAIEDRTLQSSKNSIKLLRDSEEIGVATAEELLRQREQLERTEKRLDDINNTLRFSQKHIQGIKSVFGSLKNYLSGKSGDQAPGPSFKESDSPSGTSRLGHDLENSRENVGSSMENHPGLKIRGMTWDDDAVSETDASSEQKVNKILDRNLEDMCTSLTRLKGLAEGLSEEIDTQNETLDRLTDKTDKADLTIIRQNKDMNKLLQK